MNRLAVDDGCEVTLLCLGPFNYLPSFIRSPMDSCLWAADHKSVLFITRGLEEAISIFDGVVALSADSATHPIAEFAVGLPRSRDVSEVQHSRRFVDLQREIWNG